MLIKPVMTGFAGSPAYDVTDPYDPAVLTWDEVTPAATEDWAGLWVHSQGTKPHYIVIGIGAAAAEQVVAVWTSRVGNGINSAFIPIPIMMGTRVAIATSAWTTYAPILNVQAVPAGNVPFAPGYSKLDSGPINLDSANQSGGIFTEPGFWTTAPGTVDVWSAWEEITYSGTNAFKNELDGSSLTHQYKWLGVILDHPYIGVSGNNGRVDWQIASGAPGSEVVEAEFGYEGAPNLMEQFGPFNTQPIWIPWDKPAGTRVAIRNKVSNINLAQSVPVVLLGLR